MYATLQNWLSTARAFLKFDDESRNKKLQYTTIGIVSAMTVTYIYKYYRTQKRKKENEILSEYWSATYHEARSKFRKCASSILDARQHAIIIDTQKDLSIDLCYIPGDPQSKHLLFHTSATHGVEGYAGSAIQINLLKNEISKNNEYFNENENKKRPHILFIHSLNPYGMCFNRRWNKSNIDLNRNCIFNDEKWEQLQNLESKDYKIWSEAMNPARKPNYYRDDIYFWFEVVKWIAMYGLTNLSRTIVEGQYYKKDGLFYGGCDLSIEHSKLCNFLKDDCQNIFGIDLLKTIEKLTMLDIHTGLGKYGQDTLITRDKHSTGIHEIFGDYKDQNRIIILGDDSKMGQMYKGSIGGTTGSDGYQSLFENVKNVWGMSQEFGTVSSSSVFKALRNENMSYHYSIGGTVNDEMIAYRRGVDVRNVFYIDHDPFWKRQVLNSGVDVFHRSIRR